MEKIKFGIAILSLLATGSALTFLFIGSSSSDSIGGATSKTTNLKVNETLTVVGTTTLSGPLVKTGGLTATCAAASTTVVVNGIVTACN